MVCVLQIRKDGVVAAANDAAIDLLGPCLGRRCCDVVRASTAQRFICGTACADAIADGAPTRDLTVTVRGRLCRLACTRVGDDVVIVLIPEGESVKVVVPLSEREREVLQGVARGWTNERIAEQLGVASSTVRSHVDSARSKLGATTRAHAVALAIATHQLH